VATKVTTHDPVESVYGVLKLNRSTDELITSIRVEADARRSHLEGHRDA